MLNLRWKFIFLDSALDRAIYSKMLRNHLRRNGETIGSTFHQDLLRKSHIHAHLPHIPRVPESLHPVFDPAICGYTRFADIRTDRLFHFFGLNRNDSFQSLTDIKLHVEADRCDGDSNDMQRFRVMSGVRNLHLMSDSAWHTKSNLNTYLAPFVNVKTLTLSGMVLPLDDIAPNMQGNTETLVLDFTHLKHSSLLLWGLSYGLRAGLFQANANDSKTKTIIACGLSLPPVDFEQLSRSCESYGIRLLWEP